MNEIEFMTDDNTTVKFYIIAETRIHNKSYLLVTDSDDEQAEADAYIFKDESEEDSAQAAYVMVEDDDELEAVAKVFAQELEEDDIEIEA